MKEKQKPSTSHKVLTCDITLKSNERACVCVIVMMMKVNPLSPCSLVYVCITLPRDEERELELE